MHCTNCGKEIDDNSKFCDKCGQPIAASIFCSACGTPNRAGAVVCSKCGARMSGGQPAAAPQYAPPPVVVNVAAPAPQPVAAAGGVSTKSRMVAGLLCFFFGYLGAHRFYVGKTGTAIAQLVISVIGGITVFFLVGTFVLSAVGIWIFVDFIMLLMGKFKDKNGLLLKR